jgi:hypothetical protein
MIEASTRLQGVKQLIDMEQYFVIHAARQSGKTTYLNDLTERLNAEGKYYALYCSLESMGRVVDPRAGIPEIVRKIKGDFEFSTIPHVEDFARKADYENYTNVLNLELTRFCMLLDKPLVILFDEVDCLSDDTLITFLRQLRNGYNTRSRIPFVHSIVLVGMRNIRDYKDRIRPERDTMGSASPFNIITKAMTLKNFTKEEITMLYGQHTENTGQIFEDNAIELIWEQTQGQPWLVNAIAREVIVEILQSDYTKPITSEMVKQAIQTIILRRDTHIDSLLERLKEDRVRKVVEAVIMGGDVDEFSDDFYFTCDLGLIRANEEDITPANPIYSEVIIRTLNHTLQRNLQKNAVYQIPRYLKNGQIDVDFLMRDFQQFWCENSAIWEEKFDYKESAPHLIMMAFLQRVINGGGDIRREIAAGTGRLDLCIEYDKNNKRKYPIELKIRYGEKTVAEGLEQLARYMDTLRCKEGWLAVFDRRKTVKWDNKLFMKKETIDGKTITVVGL